MERYLWIAFWEIAASLFWGGCSTPLINDEEYLMEMRLNDISGERRLSNILQLISNESELSPQELTMLQPALYQLDEQYPRLIKLLQSYYKDFGSIVFKMDSAINGNAMYSGDTGMITFHSIGYITSERVLEELLHAVQHGVVYRDKLKKDMNYMAKSKRNIEYEVLVFQDVMRYWKARQDAAEGIGDGNVGLRGATETTKNLYTNWLLLLTMWNMRDVALSEFNGRAKDWPEFWNLKYNPDFEPLLLKGYLDIILW